MPGTREMTEAPAAAAGNWLQRRADLPLRGFADGPTGR